MGSFPFAFAYFVVRSAGRDNEALSKDETKAEAWPGVPLESRVRAAAALYHMMGCTRFLLTGFRLACSVRVFVVCISGHVSKMLREGKRTPSSVNAKTKSQKREWASESMRLFEVCTSVCKNALNVVSVCRGHGGGCSLFAQHGGHVANSAVRL